MKRCLNCGLAYEASSHICPECAWAPEMKGGFLAFAPAMAVGSDGFDPNNFAALAALEDQNFWFKARNELILWALERYAPASFASFLEIGCGTGFVLQAIARRFPHITLSGSEIFLEGLSFTQERVKSAELFQMDGRKIPFRSEYDVIGAFDVLEHIDQDCEVLSEIHTALRPGGAVILTVPQHRWLWSPADDWACHVRRYSNRDLSSKLGASGFDIRYSTSFVTLLIPAMLASRLKARRSTEYQPESELKLPSTLNSIFGSIMTLERLLLRCGVRLSLGGSRLVVAIKV